MSDLLCIAAVGKVYPGAGGLLRPGRDVRAVDEVSLTLQAGRTFGIVGESGCGKSTLGRLALGLERPSNGLVCFAGAPMPAPGSAAWRALRARMQMVYQDPLAALDRRLTIAAQIEEPMCIHGGADRAERQARVAGLLADVGLGADLGGRYPHALSGGQRQRAVLARALATDPELLVCDEPVSALDVSIQAQVVNMLVDLQARRGIAMLFISHDLKLVRQVSDVVAVMYLGRVVEQGEAMSIFAAPRHPYTVALVSAVAVPGRARDRIVLRGEPPDPAARPSGCGFHPRCPQAVGTCAREIPPLRRLPDGRHVACHLFTETGDIAA